MRVAGWRPIYESVNASTPMRWLDLTGFVRESEPMSHSSHSRQTGACQISSYRPHEKDSRIRHTGRKGFWPIPDSEYSVETQESCTPNESQIRSIPSLPLSAHRGVPLPCPTASLLDTIRDRFAHSDTFSRGAGHLKEIHLDTDPQPGKRWEQESPKSRVLLPPVSRFSTEIM